MGVTVAIMRSMAMVVIPVVLMVTMVGAQYGGGNCDWSQCRYDRYLAQRCCSSSGTCCDFANGGNNGGNYGNNGNGGFNNNNKPGSCPPYNGRRKVSEGEVPRQQWQRKIPRIQQRGAGLQPRLWQWQCRQLYQRQRVFGGSEVLLPPLRLPVHPAKLLWLTSSLLMFDIYLE